ncbi:DUF4192 family protein [Arthrobacter sp. SO3]|uniref:DUF4192 family protein n=1 Tax=Arthrobacter sp. SO3 TaxID=1897057 RepID=UPI001CFFDC9A|nr:hypothetical protein [Arthrobacter sp. SO3]
MDRILLAQTNSKPHWSRVEWAEQLLLHAYTHSSTRHSAPILTAIAFINWWEGRGSKAHQFLPLALEADPGYHLARLSKLMISSGSAACHAVPPAFLHEQVSERTIRTGRNPRSI